LTLLFFTRKNGPWTA